MYNFIYLIYLIFLMKPRMQNQNFDFSKMALNRVLTLADYRSRRELSGSSGIIDFESNRVCKQFKHWNYRISVPMSMLTLHKINSYFHLLWCKRKRGSEYCIGNSAFASVSLFKTILKIYPTGAHSKVVRNLFSRQDLGLSMKKDFWLLCFESN